MCRDNPTLEENESSPIRNQVVMTPGTFGHFHQQSQQQRLRQLILLCTWLGLLGLLLWP